MGGNEAPLSMKILQKKPPTKAEGNGKSDCMDLRE